MTFAVIVVGFLLLLFLVIFTLLINPPNAWVQKLTDRKAKYPKQH
jgi:uncharacterized integral membrane protein